MKQSAKITVLYLSSAALLLLAAQAFLPLDGLARDTAILAVSGLVLFRRGARQRLRRQVWR